MHKYRMHAIVCLGSVFSKEMILKLHTSKIVGFKAVTQLCMESPSMTQLSSFHRFKADGMADRAARPPRKETEISKI